jgi:hypothetical protein
MNYLRPQSWGVQCGIFPWVSVKILRDPEICDVHQGSCVGNGSVMQRFEVRRGFAANLERDERNDQWNL